MFTAFIAQAILLRGLTSFLASASPSRRRWGPCSRQCGRLLSRGALDDPVSGRRISLRCSPSTCSGDALRDYLDPRFKT